MVNLRKDGAELWEHLLAEVLGLGAVELQFFPPWETSSICACWAGDVALRHLKDVDNSTAFAIGEHLMHLAGLATPSKPEYQNGEFIAEHGGKRVRVILAIEPIWRLDLRTVRGNHFKLKLAALDGQPA